MILGDPNAPHVVDGARATLDDLFRDALDRDPDRLALADPPNRPAFTDGAPRRLNYREADRVIGALAGRLHRLGLAADAIVGLQLPNTVEAMLAILGVLRAGMIVAPLPLLWRRADAVAALGRVGAKAIITTSRVDVIDHGALAGEIAAELFSIRHVCSFGDKIADGALPFDDLFDVEAPEPSSIERNGNPAAHVAVITFETARDGVAAVARSHNELIAGGLSLYEGGIPDAAAILTPCPPSSFAGLSLGLVPWLVGGGTLALHHPFDPEVFAAQCDDHQCDTVVVPGPLLPRFAQAGLLSSVELRNVLALWRAPERLAASLFCRRDGVCVTDVLAFGETGLIAARRGPDGRPAAIPHATGPGAELIRTAAGTLALRGTMVPRHPFPPEVGFADMSRLVGHTQAAIDTGYSCRVDPGDGTMTITSPPAGLVSVGGYRFVLRDLQNLIAGAAPGASFAALPDALSGHRLAGQAMDCTVARDALAARGANALIAEAFREPDQAAGTIR